VQELAFAWPQDMWSLQQLSARAGVVLGALGLDHIPLDTPLRQLSDGYKRRCALAVALVRRRVGSLRRIRHIMPLTEGLAGLRRNLAGFWVQVLGFGKGWGSTTS
jgi:hypothetical protein